MASLPELQRSFAAALRDPTVACAVQPLANLDVYRNTANINFREAVVLTYPVVRRRVGDDYFHQLCAHYRQRYPSRSGDLHWAGRDFAAFLDGHLAGGDYEWLADLARLEWSRAECLMSIAAPAVGVEALANISPDALEHVAFGLQPSLRLHESAFPIFTVWLANQRDNAPPSDQSAGPECGLVQYRYEVVEIRRLEPALFTFLSALHKGSTLGAAATLAAFDEASLLDALKFIFAEGLVTSVSENTNA